MKIIEAIDRIDSLKHNTYTQPEKIAWLSTLDAMAKAHVIDTHVGGEDVTFNGYDQNTDLNTVLLIPAPYEEAYLKWLEAQIDYANGEYGKYNNAIEEFNTFWNAYKNYYNRTHLPLRKQARFFGGAKNPSFGGGSTRETDPTVPSWAKRPEKPIYTALEVGALPLPSGGGVGQYFRIAAVDEYGRVIAVEAVDAPAVDVEDGFSPIATVTQTDTGAVISITDANGTTEAFIENRNKYILTEADRQDIAQRAAGLVEEGDVLENKAAKPLIIYADNAPNTGANSASGIPIFTIDYSPSDLKAHADNGGSVIIVRYNRHYSMYDATDETAKFRFIEATDTQVDWYHAVLDANKAVSITKTTHKSRMETTTGGAVGQVPIIKGLDSRGIPNAWEFGEFAPSGYGLGNASPKVISGIDALNNAKDNGWYYVTDLGWRYFGGVTVNLALVHVLSKDRYHVRQILYPAAMSVIIRREYHGASWTDWCCENPPMNPGMEYRTTELCEGLPVYAKRITHTLSEAIGNTTDNTDISIAHNITNLNFLVRCFGRKGNYPIPSYGAAGGSISINQVGPSNIILRCYRDTLSPGTIHFDLYYTKTG